MSQNRGKIWCLAATVGAVCLAASAAEARTALEAKALLERAVAHIHEVGRERGFADITRPDGGFVEGDLYVFCLDNSATVVAHGGNARLIGLSVARLSGPDGRIAGPEIVRLGQTQGHGWLEYPWPNPVTHRIEPKVTYVMKVDDSTVCGAGVYLDGAP